MTARDPNPAYWLEYGLFQKVKHDLIRTSFTEVVETQPTRR